MDNSLRSPELIVESLEAFPGMLERQVFAKDVSGDDLLRPGSDGGWGVVEILAHLRDWEEVFMQRARKVVEEQRPHVPGQDDALWPIERNYRDQDPEEVLADFRALRNDHTLFLNTLEPEEWIRTGDHSLFGEVTLQWLENHVCEHDAEHLGQIKAALAG